MSAAAPAAAEEETAVAAEETDDAAGVDRLPLRAIAVPGTLLGPSLAIVEGVNDELDQVDAGV